MRVGIVIPSRLGSTRLTEKPLQMIGGVPLVIRALRQAQQVRGVDWVLVATDSEKIAGVVEAAGGMAILTSPSINSGTDRISAVSEVVDADVYVNFQGDEPFLEPKNVEAAIELVTSGRFKMSTIATDLEPQEQDQISAVKVTTDEAGRAIAFTRSPLKNALRHLGLYVYTRDVLRRITSLPQSPNELRERLEQLRAQDDGIAIGVAPVVSRSFGIDTPIDLARAEQMA